MHSHSSLHFCFSGFGKGKNSSYICDYLTTLYENYILNYPSCSTYFLYIMEWVSIEVFSSLHRQISMENHEDVVFFLCICFMNSMVRTNICYCFPTDGRLFDNRGIRSDEKYFSFFPEIYCYVRLLIKGKTFLQFNIILSLFLSC